MSVEEYPNEIRSYLKYIINNLKKSDMWKIQLTTAITFISSIYNDEEHVMHSKSDNIEIMMNDEVDEVVKKLFNSLKSRHQIDLKSMKSSEFAFDYVHLLYYECIKVNPNRDGSYINSPDWIKSEKVTTNPINKKDNKCFQYAATVALSQEWKKKSWKSNKN